MKKVKNKTIAKILIIGYIALFCSGFITGFEGESNGLSALLSVIGYPLQIVGVVWATIRLWKTQK